MEWIRMPQALLKDAVRSAGSKLSFSAFGDMCGISLLIKIVESLKNYEILLPSDHLTPDNDQISTDSAELSISKGALSHEEIMEAILAFMGSLNSSLAKRGPDHYGDFHTYLNESKDSFMHFHGHVLSMRHLFPQPVIDCTTDSSLPSRVLLWNGECFRAPFITPPSCLKDQNEDISCDKSDTEQLFDYLKNQASIPSSLCQVEGPWSIIYYSKADNAVYFGRDPRGRRSLMIGRGVDNFEKFLVISSIPWRSPSVDIEWTEIDTKGIYRLDLIDCSLSLTEWPEEVASIAQRKSTNIVPPSSDLSALRRNDLDITNDLEMVLKQSIRRRVHYRGDHQLMNPTAHLDLAPIAVLFSGGLDSSILAALADKELPIDVPIDLINVSFGNERETQAAPDRQTALKSYADLCNSCPNRPWRMVLVNISKAELDQYTPMIASLMYPNNTVMDISISAPLWFASRGLGISTPSASQAMDGSYDSLVPYQSTAKVLLVGAGADEQFAGYGRHRVSYRKGGWLGLQEELDKDIRRLWKRNLGRDDRVLSDHGKEARFPFLDADVMSWISSQNLWDLCDMELEPGVGDKRALRLVAKRLGLHHASILPKRAIQFGTKIVKQMPKGKGTDNFEI